MQTRDFLDSIKRNREKEYYVIDIRDLRGLTIKNGLLFDKTLKNNNTRMFMLLRLTLDDENKYYFKSVYTNGQINIPNTLTLDCEQLLYNFEIDTIELNSDVSISKERDRKRLLRDSLCVKLEHIRPLITLTTEEKIEVERINNNPTEIIQRINRFKLEASEDLEKTMPVNKQMIR